MPIEDETSLSEATTFKVSLAVLLIVVPATGVTKSVVPTTAKPTTGRESYAGAV